MAGLLYYLPKRGRGIKIEDVAAAGLAYAFGKRMTPAEVAHGPDGGGGVVFADDAGVSAAQIGYYPDEQTWRKVPGTEAYVGMYKDEPTTPDDLAREQVLPGDFVELGGRLWQVPIVRGLAEEEDRLVYFNRLPKQATLDDDGNWVRSGAVGKYEHLWPIACRWWDAIHDVAIEAEEASEGDEKKERVFVEFAELYDSATEILTTNYRLGRAEVDLLNLLDDQAAAEILNVAVDLKTKRVFLEKKLAALAGSSSADGPAGAPPDTDPA